MTKNVKIELSLAEAEHLLHLIEVNEREGWYYGWDKQYWSRSNKIKTKLGDTIEQLTNITLKKQYETISNRK